MQGAPSGDGYGGTFEYTSPAPLVAMRAQRALPPLAFAFSPLCIAFCVVMNMAALMLVLPKAW